MILLKHLPISDYCTPKKTLNNNKIPWEKFLKLSTIEPFINRTRTHFVNRTRTHFISKIISEKDLQLLVTKILLIENDSHHNMTLNMLRKQ